MLKQLVVFIIAMMFVLITAIILIIYTIQRGEEFKAHQTVIQKAAVHGAAYAIDLQLSNKHRHVRLFLDEYQQLVSQLITFPNDLKTENNVNARLKQRFSDFFTFTITNQKGIPLLEDFDGLVGDACLFDLKKYFKSAQKESVALNTVFVHPKPHHYHYDIMAPLHSNKLNINIFFVSFDLRDIVDILRTHEIPGQKLVLVKHSDPALLEVSRLGTRDKLISREPRLTNAEQQSIRVYENIPNTDWRLVNIPDTQFEKHYLQGLWKEAAIIISVVTLALLLLIFISFRYFETTNKER
jgi:hypothetical protein